MIPYSCQCCFRNRINNRMEICGRRKFCLMCARHNARIRWDVDEGDGLVLLRFGWTPNSLCTAASHFSRSPATQRLYPSGSTNALTPAVPGPRLFALRGPPVGVQTNPNVRFEPCEPMQGAPEVVSDPWGGRMHHQPVDGRVFIFPVLLITMIEAIIGANEHQSIMCRC